MRWALIGASDVSARRMLPALRAAGQEVCRIYSSKLERARSFAAAGDIGAATASLGAALDDGVDAVYVSSTNDLHARHVIAAAEAHRHVLCEKPLAMTIADAEAMVAACQKNKVVLATNHHLRGSAALREVARQVQAGKIGHILSARINNAIMLSERLRTWRVSQARVGGGVMFDLAVHDIDAMRFILGRELLEVTALSASQGLGTDGVEDAVVSAQRYEGDVMVAAHEAYTVPYAHTAIEVHGSDGVLSAVDVLRPDSRGEVWLETGDGRAAVDLPHSDGMYVRVVRDFCRAAERGTRPSATGIDGLMALAGVLALRTSAATGATVTVERRGFAQTELHDLATRFHGKGESMNPNGTDVTTNSTSRTQPRPGR